MDYKNLLKCLLAVFIIAGCIAFNLGCSPTTTTPPAPAATTSGGTVSCYVLTPQVAARDLTKITYVPLSGARVSVIGYNKYATTGSNGLAEVQGLSAGTYTVAVGKAGYDCYTYSNVTVYNGGSAIVGSGAGVNLQTSSAPGILDLSSYKGPPGIPIKITGINFGSTQGTSTVMGDSGSSMPIVSWSDTQIVFTLPASASARTVNLKVTVGSSVSNSVPFTIIAPGGSGNPNMTNINPVSEAEEVTITGTNFGSTQGSSFVRFNGTRATLIVSWSDTSIVCGVPSGAIDGGVVVIVNGVSSNAMSFAEGIWSAMSSTGTTNSLRGVWGTASNNVYAVGDSGTIRKYDGSIWSGIDIGAAGTNLNAIWGTSASNIYVAGNSGKFWQYNGSAWLLIPLDGAVGININGIWGFSANDVFVVGGSGKIWHYNGTNWSAQTSGTANNLRGVWGTSSSNVYAVGDLGTIIHTTDGTNWSLMQSGSATRLNSAWGSGAGDNFDDVFAVGNSGVILHYNGAAWSVMTSGTTTTNLNGVWGTASNNVYAVGASGAIFYYNGNSSLLWTAVFSPTSENLRGIWGTSAFDIFAVGDSGTILHYTQ